MDKIQPGIITELFWNYERKYYYREEKREKKGPIIPPVRLAWSQTESGITAQKNWQKHQILIYLIKNDPKTNPVFTQLTHENPPPQ